MEKYLTTGQLLICPIGELCLRATYMDMHRNVTTVDSNRGITHLLLLLEARIEESEDMEKDAERQFPYPPPAHRTSVIDSFMNHVYAEIHKNGSVQAQCFNIGPGGMYAYPAVRNIEPLNEKKQRKLIPGIYFRPGVGATIVEALLNAKEAQFEYYPLPSLFPGNPY